ncbi:MAG: polysulfide reductase NrfD [Desulfobacterales bacterium]|jgi:protein NrfD
MNKTQKTIVFIIWLGLALWGLYGVFQRMSQGELLVHYGSYIPWGLWVAGKIYFVGLAVGSSFLVWVIYAFDIQRLRPLVRPALLISLVTMIAGLLTISFDLGHMWRLYEVFTRPNFSSLLAIATWLTMLYLLYVAWALVTEIASGGKTAGSRFAMGWIGIFFALMFSGANGAEFATLVSNPYWHSALGPILSIGGALLSGVALVLAAAALLPTPPSMPVHETLKILSRTVVGLLLFVLMLEWSEYSVSMWYSRDESFRLMSSILFGSGWYVFWIFHILLGSIVPLVVLLWKPTGRLTAAIGGGLVAVFYISVRLNHVIPGFITPALKGLQEAYTDRRLRFEYFPSANEWAVFAFAVALVFVLFYIGYRILSLSPLKSANEGGK